MSDEDRTLPLTEDVILYLLYQTRIVNGSHLFFKLKHNITWGDRDWCFWFAPDVDLLEIKSDGTVIGYEVKGQRKLKDRYEWPARYEGLDQAMAYLELPYIIKKGDILYDGGAMDMVYLVHACASKDVFPKSWLHLLSLTPIGLMAVTPTGQIFEVLPAKKNPIMSEEAKQFLLKNLSTLSQFSVESRTFRMIERNYFMMKGSSWL